MSDSRAFLLSVFPDSLFRAKDIGDLAYGSAFLGGGGGGDPYVGSLLLRSAMQATPAIKLVAPSELADSAMASLTALIGSPTVMIEKLPGLAEIRRSLAMLDRHAGERSQFSISVEAGGINGLTHLIAAAEMDVEAIDGDLAGRAIPEGQMTTIGIYNQNPPYSVIADEHGNGAVVAATDSHETEKMLRALTVTMGSAAVVSSGFMAGSMLREFGIANTTSIATLIGRAVRLARETKSDPVAALLDALRHVPHYNRCGVLFSGKVVDVSRQTTGGWNRGTVKLAQLNGSETMTIEFQNEYIIARHGEVYRASMPDLISIVNSETADVILAESLRYGQRVTVVGASVPDIMRTQRALEVLGPRIFGYDVDYQKIEEINGFDRTSATYPVGRTAGTRA